MPEEETALDLAKKLGSLAGAKNALQDATDTARDETKDLALKEKRLSLKAKELAVERTQLENADHQAYSAMRKSYSNRVYYYLLGYSIFVGLVILLAGFGCWGFKLEESVLDFLVGSTAASAIGLVAAVTLGLFGPKSKD